MERGFECPALVLFHHETLREGERVCRSPHPPRSGPPSPRGEGQYALANWGLTCNVRRDTFLKGGRHSHAARLFVRFDYTLICSVANRLTSGGITSSTASGPPSPRGEGLNAAQDGRVLTCPAARQRFARRNFGSVAPDIRSLAQISSAFLSFPLRGRGTAPRWMR